MNCYSSFKELYLNKHEIGTYLDLLEKVEEFKNEGQKGIFEIFLPEPNFTRILQAIKSAKGCNVWTDNWGKFDEMIDGVHCRIGVKGGRMRENEIKKFKGENSL